MTQVPIKPINRSMRRGKSSRKVLEVLRDDRRTIARAQTRFEKLIRWLEKRGVPDRLVSQELCRGEAKVADPVVAARERRALRQRRRRARRAARRAKVTDQS